MRLFLRGLVVIGVLLAARSHAALRCGGRADDAVTLAAAQDAVAAQCDCCGAPNHGQYLRCVVRATKAAVRAGTLRPACKGRVVREAAHLPCPLSAQSPLCRPCNADADCQASEFCECPPGSCSKAAGTCVPRPAACPQIYAPVCGCDDNTYVNDCARREAGVCKRADGPCTAGQCFDTISRRCTGVACGSGKACPLPNQLCTAACPPPPPSGACFDFLDRRCTGQACGTAKPCLPNEACLAECPPPSSSAGCFVTVDEQCSGQPCSPGNPCREPNEICSPRCTTPSSTTSTTLGSSTTSTTVPGCRSDADCGDGNPCTVDRCVGGQCEHACVCLDTQGAVSCCPGPAALCVKLCGADAAGTCGGTCPAGATCKSLSPATTACGCVSGVGGPCGGNLFTPPLVCAPGLVCQQTNPDATGVCVQPKCIPFFGTGCSQTSDCCQPCGAGIVPPCAVCLQGTCSGAP